MGRSPALRFGDKPRPILRALNQLGDVGDAAGPWMIARPGTAALAQADGGECRKGVGGDCVTRQYPAGHSRAECASPFRSNAMISGWAGSSCRMTGAAWEGVIDAIALGLMSAVDDLLQ